MNEAERMGKVRGPDYNCAHYVAELWQDETGQDIRHVLGGFLARAGARCATPAPIHTTRRIHAPVSPCIVLFRRVKAVPHIGIYLRGRVVHLAGQRPIRQPLAVARLGYTSVRYYAVR